MVYETTGFEGEAVFVALEITENPPKSIFGGILNILTLPKVEVEPRTAFGGRFVALCSVKSRKGVDWQAVQSLCGRYLDRVLLPGGLEPPPESGIRPPQFPRYRRQVLLDTACELIQRTRMPMYRRILGLVDEKGEHMDLLPVLLKYYTSVKVVTGETERYGQAAEDMMESLGAPVLVSESLTSLSDCVVILSPEAFYTAQSCRLPCPVLSGGLFSLPGTFDSVMELRVPPGPEIQAACPEGIGPEDFAAALFEFCGAKDMPTIADKMLYNHRVSNLAEVVQAVLQSAGYPGRFS